MAVPHIAPDTKQKGLLHPPPLDCLGKNVLHPACELEMLKNYFVVVATCSLRKRELI